MTVTLRTLTQVHGPARQLSAVGLASLKEKWKGHSLVPPVRPVVAAACVQGLKESRNGTVRAPGMGRCAHCPQRLIPTSFLCVGVWGPLTPFWIYMRPG